MTVDVHCHYVSPRVRAAVEREGERYGVRAQGGSAGEPLLQIGEQTISRPLSHEIQELEQRQAVMAEQTVDQQLLSTWLDCTGYSLPADRGAAWARLLNDAMAEDVKAAPDGRFAAVCTVPL